MKQIDQDVFHERLSRSEKYRSSAAKIIRNLLILSLPLLITGLLIFVTCMIFITRPYVLTKDFTRTTCRVSGYTVDSEGSYSCSDGTDPFHPCVKVQVMYGISNATSYLVSTIMENEQSLVSCSQCSYTFGKHGLLHHNQVACNTWLDTYNPMDCVHDFILKNTNEGLSFPCFFNPGRPKEVVRSLEVNSTDVIHSISWPIIISMIYVLGLIFVWYDIEQVKLFNKQIQEEIAKDQKMREQEHKVAQERTKSQLGRSLGVYRFERNLSSLHDIAMPPFIQQTELAVVPIVSGAGSCQLSGDDIEIAPNGDDMIHNGLENVDLRHLDLAVSPRNIDDLAAVAHSPSPDEANAYAIYHKQLEITTDAEIVDSVKFELHETPSSNRTTTPHDDMSENGTSSD